MGAWRVCGRGWGGWSRLGMRFQPANVAFPLEVCCQESRHLLCKLSDNHHHLMAPKRQWRPSLQCLWPLLQAAQCESALFHLPHPSPGTTALCAARQEAPATLFGLAWESPERQKGSHKRGQAGWSCVPHSRTQQAFLFKTKMREWISVVLIGGDAGI